MIFILHYHGILQLALYIVVGMKNTTSTSCRGWYHHVHKWSVCAKGQGTRCKGQDQHQRKSEWDATSTCNSKPHHHRPAQGQAYRWCWIWYWSKESDTVKEIEWKWGYQHNRNRNRKYRSRNWKIKSYHFEKTFLHLISSCWIQYGLIWHKRSFHFP